ncbi:MAG: GlsB/YeaQ/YmgE family stress response membrane protein [Pseudomonadota bacterium]|nr:GlsB/YeaQ/YmgE family stress response membrane protein [Pseudomonadota bacterium]
MLAKFVTHGAGPKGFFMTAALGIAGSIIATYLGRALGWYAAGTSAGFIGSFIGAIVLLLIYHVIVRNRSPTV